MAFTDEERHQHLVDMQFLLEEAVKLQEENEPKDDVDKRLLDINRRGLENITRLLAESDEKRRG